MFTLLLTKLTAMGWTVVDADAFVVSFAHYGKRDSEGVYWLLMVEDNGDGTVTVEAERRTDAMGDPDALYCVVAPYHDPYGLLMTTRKAMGRVR